jgi:parallel beta-helix repeat protein
MIIILAILLVQPVVVGLSMPFSFNLVQPSRALAQDAGNRIELGDLMNHVPVVIDGTDDFISQSWPGSGTPADPYVIAGLNITQDYFWGSIYIRNTNASFVIRDCYIYQGDAEHAVSFVNTTAAMIEYTTIETPAAGIFCNNANNTVLDHSIVAAGSLYALEYYYSNDCELHYNAISTNYRIFYATYCANIDSSYNVYDGNSGWFSTMMTYCNGSSYSFDTWLDGYSFNIQNSYDLSFTDLIVDNAGGLRLNGGNGLEVLRCNFTSNNDDAIDASSVPNIIIQDTYVQSQGSQGIRLINSDNVSIMNAVAEHNNFNGLNINNCDNIYVSGMSVLDSGTAGVEIQNSNNVTLDDLDISETGGIGLHVVSCNNGTLTNSDFQETDSHGVDINTGANWTITDNTFMNIADIAITHSTGENLVIMRNYMDIVNLGFDIFNAVNATIIDNHVTQAIEYGLIIDASFHPEIADNTFEAIEEGLYVTDCNNASVLRNDVFSEDFNGIYMEDCDYSVIHSNTVEGGHTGGISVNSMIECEIVNNTLTNSGIISGGTGPIAEFIHHLENNTVNGLPIYYNPGATGLDVVASNYGQVILVNNTWMDVHDGSFGIASIPVELAYSSNCELWDIDTTGNYYGFGLISSQNLTLYNITHHGGHETSGIAALNVDNVTVRDSEFFDCTGWAAFQGSDVVNLTFIDNLVDGCYRGVTIITGIDLLISNNQFLNLHTEAFAIWSSASYDIKIIDNIILNATQGVYADSPDYLTIIGNTFMYCNSNGVYIVGTSADFANITQNIFEMCYNGIQITNGDLASITNNTIMWNSWVGISLTSSASTEVYYNTIVHNLGDNGRDNTAGIWDDGSILGNYWDDFTPPAPYSIDGTGGAVDNYPMQFLPTEPIINQPQDIYYAEGSEDNEILWYALDDSLKNWVATIDGEVWASDAWNFDNITVNIDGLSYGTHTVELTLWDVDQNNVTDTVIVHVFDDTPPVISNTPNGEAFSTATSQTLSWEVSDLHPDTYTAYLDGEEWTTGTWTTGVLETSIDGLTPGEHALVMEIADIDGNTAFDTVLIMVYEDLDNPIVNSPDDFTYTLGDTGNVIEWVPSDDHPSWFEVTYGGSILADGEWAGSRVALNVDGLTNGTHSFRLTVYDGTGNSADDTVIVTVVLPTPDATPPPPPFDLGMIGLVVAVVGGAAIIIVIVIIALKKKKTPY